MNDLVDLLSAWAWPLVLIGLLVVYRKSLRRVLGQVSGLKIAGQEVFFRSSLDFVSRVMPGTGPGREYSEWVFPRPGDKIMNLCASNPRDALVLLDKYMDREIRLVAYQANWTEVTHQQYSTLWQRLYLVSQNADWSPDLLETMALWAHMRDVMLQSETADFTEDNYRRLVPPGLAILGMIRSIPLEKFAVVAAGVPVYKNEQLSEVIPGASAVIIATTDGPASTPNRAFYTRRDYAAGTRVGWHWEAQETPEAYMTGYVSNPSEPGGVLGVLQAFFDGRDLTDLLRDE